VGSCFSSRPTICDDVSHNEPKRVEVGPDLPTERKTFSRSGAGLSADSLNSGLLFSYGRHLMFAHAGNENGCDSSSLWPYCGAGSIRPANSQQRQYITLAATLIPSVKFKST